MGGSRLTSEHFAIEWETGLIAAETAQETLDHFESAWAFEVEEQGWRAPVGSEDYLLLIELETGSGQEYTYGSTCPDGREMAVFKVFVSGIYAESVAAHELHHAIQAAYGFAHERWFWEATATWVQWHAVPSEDNYVHDLVSQGYLAYPELALTRSDRDTNEHAAHQYAMALFLETLPEGMVQELWEAGEGRDESFNWPIEDAFAAIGEDLDSHYLSFVEDAVTDRWGLGLPTARSGLGAYPADSKAPDGFWPETRGQSLVWLDPDGVDPEHGDVAITVDVDPEAELVGWLVAQREDSWEVQDVEVIDGMGEVVLDDLSTTDEGAWLVLTPLAGDLTDWLYLLTAEAVGDPPANKPRTSSGAGFEEPGACSIGGFGAGGAWLLGLMALRRRRP